VIVGNKNPDVKMSKQALTTKVSCAPLRTGLHPKDKAPGPAFCTQHYGVPGMQQQNPQKQQEQKETGKHQKENN
jgi:hypothetical protein